MTSTASDLDIYFRLDVEAVRNLVQNTPTAEIQPLVAPPATTTDPAQEIDREAPRIARLRLLAECLRPPAHFPPVLACRHAPGTVQPTLAIVVGFPFRKGIAQLQR